MTVLAHWLAFEADSLAACHYIDEAEEAANMTRLGYRVEGPFVPEQQLRGAVEALKRYGFHDGDCPACLVDEPGPCDCGWDDVALTFIGGQ